jgi:hypothetical protein
MSNGFVVEELLDLVQDTTLHLLQIFAKRFVSAVFRELSTSVNWFWHHRFGKKARSFLEETLDRR